MDSLYLKETYKLNDLQMNNFEELFNILIAENAKYNLTTILDKEAVYEKHFYDSLSILLNNSLEGTLVDVGSGGGFPGIPLAIALPNLKVTYLDSNNKKINYIKLVSEKLNLDSSYIIGRAEECSNKFNYVSARGVASLNILLELVANLIKDNGIFIAMKGSNYKEELENSKNAINKLGYEIINIQEYYLPFEKSMHCNIYFRKIKSHDPKYPRPYSQIKKKPL